MDVKQRNWSKVTETFVLERGNNIDWSPNGDSSAQWNKLNGEADMVLRINFTFIIYILVNFIAVIYPSAFESDAAAAASERFISSIQILLPRSIFVFCT